MNLTSLPLFQGLTAPTLTAMREHGALHQRTFEKGAVIFHTGDVVHELGIVLFGRVQIETIDLWGSRGILSSIGPGETFAETYAFCRVPLMVDAVSAQESEVLFLDLDVVQDCPICSVQWAGTIQSNLLKVFARKNLTLSQRIFCTSAKTIRGRLLTYLSAQAVQHGSSSFEIPFNRQQLADYLNLDRSALSKELGRMRQEGLLEFQKNRFTLYADPLEF